jgi:hypothetical protein
MPRSPRRGLGDFSFVLRFRTARRMFQEFKMTPIGKHMLELCELEALVVSCLQCKTSVSFSLSANRLNFPTCCPNCAGAWFQEFSPASDPSLRERVKHFFEAFRRLQMEVNEENLRHHGVAVRFEVNSLSACRQIITSEGHADNPLRRPWPKPE